jgi:hypothetical protein
MYNNGKTLCHHVYSYLLVVEALVSRHPKRSKRGLIAPSRLVPLFFVESARKGNRVVVVICVGSATTIEMSVALTLIG